MTWRTFFLKSKEAVELESSLQPHLVERRGLSSTANTDTENLIINLDISQPPLKCALSYAYELKNLENAAQYAAINDKAKKGQIKKITYLISIFELEAEAVYFRSLVFRSFGIGDENFPYRKEYLDIYDLTHKLSEEQVIKKLALFISENAVVRREHSAKKYYADCHDYYSGKKNWPSFYNESRQKAIMTVTLSCNDELCFDEISVKMKSAV